MRWTTSLSVALTGHGIPNTKVLPEFLHKSGKPLEEVIVKLKRNAAEGQQLSMLDGYGNECAGVCEV